MAPLLLPGDELSETGRTLHRRAPQAPHRGSRRETHVIFGVVPRARGRSGGGRWSPPRVLPTIRDAPGVQPRLQLSAACHADGRSRVQNKNSEKGIHARLVHQPDGNYVPHKESQGGERDAIFQARSEESECQRSERSPAHNRVCTAFSCRMHASLERLPAPGGERQRRLLVEASAPPLIPLVKKCTDRLCRQPEGGGAEALGGLLPATSQRRL